MGMVIVIRGMVILERFVAIKQDISSVSMHASRFV